MERVKRRQRPGICSAEGEWYCEPCFGGLCRRKSQGIIWLPETKTL